MPWRGLYWHCNFFFDKVSHLKHPSEGGGDGGDLNDGAAVDAGDWSPHAGGRLKKNCLTIDSLENGFKWYCAKYSYKRRNRTLLIANADEEQDDTRHSNLTRVCKL